MKQATYTFSFPHAGAINEVFETTAETRYNRDSEHAGAHTSSRFIGEEVQVEAWLNITARLIMKPATQWSNTQYQVQVLGHSIDTAPTGVVCKSRVPIISKTEIVSAYESLLEPETTPWNGEAPEYSPISVPNIGQWEKQRIER